MPQCINTEVFQTPSTFKDPFNKNSFDSAIIIISDRFRGAWNGSCMEATIKFHRGDTSGEHKVRADNLHELGLKLTSFIESLE